MDDTLESAVAEEKVLTRIDLLALGYSPKLITKGVRAGSITRLRRDHYVITDESESVKMAVRVGGRLTCASALAEISPDVFLFEDDHVHVHVGRRSSRLRSAGDSRKRWSRETANGVRLTWDDLTALPAGRHLVDIVDAVRALVRCRSEREAVATIDSLLRLGLISMPQVREAVASLPRRYRRLPELLDPRAESGPESFMRLLLLSLGVNFDVQVKIGGVGRVDFVVEGFLIVECDSKAFHEGWEKQREDRRRDLAAAERGYFTLRVLAEDLLYDPERVTLALRGLLSARSVAEHVSRRGSGGPSGA